MPKRDIAYEGNVVDSDSLCTPPTILDPIYELYEGMIDVDPCSNPHSIVRAKIAYYTGGLTMPWSANGRVGGPPGNDYENHPYSINDPWMQKAVYEMKVGHVRELVVLCMAAPSTYWWQGFMIKPRVNPRVVCTGRLKFMGPDGRPMKDTARFDTALIYYPSRKSRVAKFDRLFKHVTRWSTWGR